VLIAINNFSLWFFVWDDRHDRDIAHRRQQSWSRLRDGLHAALDAPRRYIDDPDPLVSAFCDCVGKLFGFLSDNWNAKFTAHFHATIDAYDQEYRNRTSGSIPAVTDYLTLRHDTFGMWVWIDCLELAADYELPIRVYSSSSYREAGLASQEFSAWYNDLHSMPKELAAGDFHNLGIVLAHQEGLTMRQAANEVARRITGRIASYQRHEADVGHLLDSMHADTDLRAGVARCLFNMRNWISSVHYFHDESGRYQSHDWQDPAKPPYVRDPND
jgi:epi-isozizaene synthase